jgi:NDP-4-keto-2,6-dideoxyhexose 3-C-methyltransferase
MVRGKSRRLKVEYMSNYREVSKCRICKNSNLVQVLSLGELTLTGVFPKSQSQQITKGPLALVKCIGEDVCGLVQMMHSFDSEEMYGGNYGYRSGLNPSMVSHLHSIAKEIESKVSLQNGDTVIDIGSNDSTLLQGYSKRVALELIGVDPTGVKLKQYYPPHIKLISDFFPSENLKNNLKGKKAKVITSISMIYDLEEPQAFVNQISECLDTDGVWVFEQSYLPLMLEAKSYDTICHEHLEYYCLSQIDWMLGKAGLKILDVVLNSINGGSFRVMASHKKSALKFTDEKVKRMIQMESDNGFNETVIWAKFQREIEKSKEELISFLERVKSEKKNVIGVGASTKGNVLLQYCGIGPELLPVIAEVNSDKFGSFTPQTLIPIVSEENAEAYKPDYKIILPWHFRNFFISKEKEFLATGGSLVFPLPKFEIYRL